MKKMGFIDHYIDEWHANNYPTWIRQSSFKGRFEVALAWQEISPEGKKTIDQWCQEQGVGKASSLEQVVEACDCLVVLSPDNPERHEDLADLPLKSGKPVYIDKPIAPSLAAAKRLFEKAEKHGTSMMSCSALRYSSELEEALKKVSGKPVSYVGTRGGGDFESYAIHQLEMLVMTLGTGARQVMQCGNQLTKLMVIDYPDGRRGSVGLLPGHPFQLSASYGQSESVVLNNVVDFFPRFIEAMLGFFEIGLSPVAKEETLEIAALLEAGCSALKAPDQWTSVPR